MPLEKSQKLAFFHILRKKELLPSPYTLDDMNVPVALVNDSGWLCDMFDLKMLGYCKVGMQELLWLRKLLEDTYWRMQQSGWWYTIRNMTPLFDEYGDKVEDPEEYKDSGLAMEVNDMRIKVELMLENYSRIENEGELWLAILPRKYYIHRDKPWFMNPNWPKTDEENAKCKRWMEAVVIIRYEIPMFKDFKAPSEDWYRKGLWKELLDKHYRQFKRLC